VQHRAHGACGTPISVCAGGWRVVLGLAGVAVNAVRFEAKGASVYVQFLVQSHRDSGRLIFLSEGLYHCVR
jgi:hypothetical protein